MLPENRTTDRQLSAATSSSIQGISNLCLLPSESFYGYRIMTPASTNPLLAGQHSGHPILLRTYHRKTKRPWERNLSSSTVAIKEKVCNRVSWPPVPVRYRGGLYIAGARENTRHFHGRDHIQWSSTKICGICSSGSYKPRFQTRPAPIRRDQRPG